ncbi:MAG: hypothetical protein DI537_06110 [Stutzerimonas stutzeri]|nr:MAG: hypothetical protein DI537_06110 [Stutzerimonas stutzeri]
MSLRAPRAAADSYAHHPSTQPDAFSLLDAGLPLGSFRHIIHSSDGLGWSAMAAAFTATEPYDAALASSRHVWIGYSYDPIEAEIERQSTLLKTEIAPRTVAIQPFDLLGSIRVVAPVRCLHLIVRDNVIRSMQAQIYGGDVGKFEIMPSSGQKDVVLEHLVLSGQALLSEPQSAFRADYLAYAIAAHLTIRSSRVRHDNGLPLAVSLSRRKLAQIDQFLRANLDKNFTFSELARSVGLSRTEFFVRFSHTTGSTPHSYLQRLRFEHAKHLLETSAMTLKEIAAASGYADAAHLSRHFKRYAHLPPGRFRRQGR